MEKFILIQKIILKYFWPLIRYLNLESLGGVYSRHGEDIFVLSALSGHLFKNDNSKIIEINKPDNLPYSLSTAFVLDKSCTSVLINTHNNLVLSYAKQVVKLKGLLETKSDVVSNDIFGSVNSLKDFSKLYSYSSNDELASSLKKNFSQCSLIILNYDSDSLLLLDKLINEIRVYSILLMNNNSGLFSIGDMPLRDRLALSGYIFNARLNDKDDFFVLSELINGFPGHIFTQINTVKLQRWVSSPPDSDFTVPK
jgi:hypothetical protein